MKVSLEDASFPMKVPFAITGSVWTHTEVLQLTLESEGFVGRGESTGTYYLNESPESMRAELEPWLDRITDDLTPEALMQEMQPCGARNVLDCALWDLRAKRLGQSIWQLLDIEPRELVTVFTLGIAEPALMGERATEARAFPHLKIKLDADRPIERLEIIRAARPDASLVIDVNQGWSFDELQEYLPHCERLGVAMIEQPLARGADEALEGFVSPVPLGADESCLHLGEFEAAARRYQVLNIKLDKSGGLTEGLGLVKAAQEAGMDLMVGNMTGTSLSMAPSYVIGQFCSFVDIDGPLLLAEDVDNGLDYRDGGRVGLPPSVLWG
ncbi:MAG: dipeptide epimerase [Pseudomonadota bacterium]